MLVQDMNMNLTRYAFAMTLLILLDGNFLQHFWLLSSMIFTKHVTKIFYWERYTEFPRWIMYEITVRVSDNECVLYPDRDVVFGKGAIL